MNVMRMPASYADGSKMLLEAKYIGIFPTPDESMSFKCADCDSVATEYEHRDYNYPLNVVPICHSCNVKRGAGKGINREENLAHNAELTALRRKDIDEFNRRNNRAILKLKRMVKSWAGCLALLHNGRNN